MDNLLVPHKVRVSNAAKKTVGNKINRESFIQNLVNGIDNELIAQNIDDKDLQSILKSQQDEKDEITTGDVKEFGDIFMPLKTSDTIAKYITSGITLNFIRDYTRSGMRIESNDIPEEIMLWDDSIKGFDSIESFNTLAGIVQSVSNPKDLLPIARKFLSAEGNGYVDGITDRDAERERDAATIEYLINFFKNVQYVLHIPLGFSRIKSVQKINIIEGVKYIKIDLDENDIDRFSIMVKDDTLIEVMPIFIKSAPNGAFIVDEELDLQYHDNTLIQESVYPSIGDSLTF